MKRIIQYGYLISWTGTPEEMGNVIHTTPRVSLSTLYILIHLLTRNMFLITVLNNGSLLRNFAINFVKLLG